MSDGLRQRQSTRDADECDHPVYVCSECDQPLEGTAAAGRHADAAHPNVVVSFDVRPVEVGER